MDSPAAESPAPAVDWAAISTPVECPLCLYNLRGLSDPRCPECGYQFEWAELLDPQHPKHPFLFEHHPRRNLWSFFKTLFASLRPRRFWTSVRPIHDVVPRRLLIYWIICCLPVLLIPLSDSIFTMTRVANMNVAMRASYPPSRPPLYSAQTRQNFLDSNHPLPPDPRFFRQVFGRHLGFVRVFLPSLLMQGGWLAFWPWLTFLALLVFQQSMRRAKVRPAHVLRCTIYCADANIWYLLAVLALAIVQAIYFAVTTRNPYTGIFRWELIEWLGMLLAILRIDRLAVAYKRYLHFRHPLATVLLSQVMVWLGWWAILYWGMRMIRD